MSDYIEVECGWYNELIRTKAKWDLLIDCCIHKGHPEFDTEEVNYLVSEYYSQVGRKSIEETKEERKK